MSLSWTITYIECESCCLHVNPIMQPITCEHADITKESRGTNNYDTARLFLSNNPQLPTVYMQATAGVC